MIEKFNIEEEIPLIDKINEHSKFHGTEIDLEPLNSEV